MAGFSRIYEDVFLVFVQDTSMVQVLYWFALCTGKRLRAILFEKGDFLLSREVALVALPDFND